MSKIVRLRESKVIRKKNSGFTSYPKGVTSLPDDLADEMLASGAAEPVAAPPPVSAPAPKPEPVGDQENEED